MRRLAAQTGIALACALAGLLAAGFVAHAAPASSRDETVTDPGPTPQPAVIADGVTIGGVLVWGLTSDEASAAVREVVRSPLDLWYANEEILLNPEALKVRAAIDAAVSRALKAEPDTAVPLRVRFDAARVRSRVAQIAHRYDRAPVQATVKLRNGKPIILTGKVGQALLPKKARLAIAHALQTNERDQVNLPIKTLSNTVGAAAFGPAIVIRRSANTLRLFRPVKASQCGVDKPRCPMQLWKLFRVATGQAAYPTPTGAFGIIVMWKNPWWYPPDSAWAKGEEPVPPGPGNPLGTRWMGLSAPGVGIHGTPDAASIGYSASHGCIRMKIPEAEWLFDHVRIGTPVFILP